jgi:hypothetical protein
MNPLHMVAEARGVPHGAGSSCAFCGHSPFDRYGDLSAISEAVMAARRWPQHDSICTGCRSLLEGKPGSSPPPLRMQNLLVVDGEITYPTTKELREVLASPPASPFVVSWATSKKKHHVLRAGVSCAELQAWGSDDGTILIANFHRLVLLPAIEALLRCHPRTAVLTGAYSPAAIASQGPAAWSSLEDKVRFHRGLRLFDLLCAIAFKPEKLDARKEDSDMVDPTDDLAATLLAHVARASAYRTNRGLDFWNGYFRSRIERHNHRPLPERLSRLFDECECSLTAVDTREALEAVANLDELSTSAIESALRGRAALLVAMAFTKIKAEKAAKER